MASLVGFEDYTDYQNERIILGKKQKSVTRKTQKGVDGWLQKNGGKYSDVKVSEGPDGYTIEYTDGYETESFAAHKERTGEDLANFTPTGPEQYWDYGKTGKENAEHYLQMCTEAGRMPKFWNFLADNGDGSFSLQPDGSTDGYWKTLIDYKMYDNDGNGAPQRPVTPDFNMEEAERVLAEYPGGANELPSASDEFIDKYVKHYEKAHGDDAGERKYSITTADDGNSIAVVDKANIQTLLSMEGNSLGAKVRNYLRTLYRNTVLPLGDEGKAYISKTSTNEYTNPAKAYDRQDIYDSKMKAAADFADLLKASQYITWAEDNGRHPDAVRGWDYYRTYFAVPDGSDYRIFRGDISVKKNWKGDEFHDVTDIRDITSTAQGQSYLNTVKKESDTGGISVKPSPRVGEAAESVQSDYTDSIAQTGENVKGNIKHSVSPADDAAYMRAVEDGDTETAQRMADEAAEANGYDTGYLVYRGDSAPYNYDCTSARPSPYARFDRCRRPKKSSAELFSHVSAGRTQSARSRAVYVLSQCRCELWLMLFGQGALRVRGYYRSAIMVGHEMVPPLCRPHRAGNRITKASAFVSL